MGRAPIPSRKLQYAPGCGWCPVRAGSRRTFLLLPSSVRDLAADQGERALGGVGEPLLFCFEVRFATVRSLEDARPYRLLNLLGDDL